MVKQLSQNQVTQSGAEIPDRLVWYYVFTSGDEFAIPLYQRISMGVLDVFSKKRLSVKPTHVFAFAQMGDALLFVEPTKEQIVTSVRYNPEGGGYFAEDAVAILASKGCAVVESTHKPNFRKWKHILSWVPTCVSAVKIITNYPSLALTPNMLYNDLVS